MKRDLSLALCLQGHAPLLQAFAEGVLSEAKSPVLLESQRIELLMGASHGAVLSCIICSCLERRGFAEGDAVQGDVRRALKQFSETLRENLCRGGVGNVVLHGTLSACLHGLCPWSAGYTERLFGCFLDEESVLRGKTAVLLTSFSPKGDLVAFANRAFLDLPNALNVTCRSLGKSHPAVKLVCLQSPEDLWSALHSSYWHALLREAPFLADLCGASPTIPLEELALDLGFRRIRTLSAMEVSRVSPGEALNEKALATDPCVKAFLCSAIDALLLVLQNTMEAAKDVCVCEKTDALEAVALRSKAKIECFYPDDTSIGQCRGLLSSGAGRRRKHLELSAQDFCSLVYIFKEQARRLAGPTRVFSGDDPEESIIPGEPQARSVATQTTCGERPAAIYECRSSTSQRRFSARRARMR